MVPRRDTQLRRTHSAGVPVAQTATSPSFSFERTGWNGWSTEQLRDLVGRVRAGLLRLGVRRGDRVVALMPNSVETLAAFLATASLGAIWSSCSPDFGLRAVHDRFAQLEPSVFLAVDGYAYGGKAFDIRDRTPPCGTSCRRSAAPFWCHTWTPPPSWQARCAGQS